MEKNNCVAIIPARYASTRFPGKPLVIIGGKTMIQRVYEQVKLVIDDVFVATDDQRIYEEVSRFGGKALMTSPDLPSGTDRVYAACQQLAKSYDIVVNVQGDEPFIHPDQISTLLSCFDAVGVDIATLARVITEEDGLSFLENPNHVKVVTGARSQALYFSRSVIPFIRNAAQFPDISSQYFLVHLGIYAYRTSILKEIVSLQPSVLELKESLEQLRWLENGYRIHVGLTKHRSVGIDTPQDLQLVEQYL